MIIKSRSGEYQKWGRNFNSVNFCWNWSPCGLNFMFKNDHFICNNLIFFHIHCLIIYNLTLEPKSTKILILINTHYIKKIEMWPSTSNARCSFYLQIIFSLYIYSQIYIAINNKNFGSKIEILFN